MILLIFFFVIVIVVSFVCSLLESILLSLTLSYAMMLEKEGKKSGPILWKLKEGINRPLSAILTLNTLANTLGSAGVGAQTLKVFGSPWVAITSGILTFCILIFSEIIPKTVGTVYWKQLAPTAAYAIRAMIFICYPFVVGTEFISRLITARAPRNNVSREEMIVTAEMGRSEGEIKEREIRVIKNLLRLNHIYARDVLTPRSVLFIQPRGITISQVLEENKSINFSRIPIYGTDTDDINSLVYRFEMSRLFSEGKGDLTLSEIAHPLPVVPESRSIADILDDFIKKREHIFLVVDEYGGTSGIITLEDAIETLLGVEIVDELDAVDDMREYAKKIWANRRKAQKLY